MTSSLLRFLMRSTDMRCMDLETRGARDAQGLPGSFISFSVPDAEYEAPKGLRSTTTLGRGVARI